ncbi:MAG: hypothetical protein ACXABY_28735, partial [Candidatus Thorarchaeota archaeon]
MNSSTLSAVEITAIPRSYLLQPNEERQNNHKDNLTVSQIKLDRFLSALLVSDIEIGFRIQVISGQARLFYLSHHHRAQRVVSSFLPQFPNFSLSSSFPIATPGLGNPIFAAEIRGVPQSVPNSLDGLADALVRSDCSPLYQVWASPKKPSFIGRQVAKWRYGSVLGRSQRQDTVESKILGNRETRTRFDVDALRATER